VVIIDVARAARFSQLAFSVKLPGGDHTIDYPWLYKDSTPKITLRNIEFYVLEFGAQNAERCVRAFQVTGVHAGVQLLTVRATRITCCQQEPEFRTHSLQHVVTLAACLQELSEDEAGDVRAYLPARPGANRLTRPEAVRTFSSLRSTGANRGCQVTPNRARPTCLCLQAV
jgi:hypothetical protein